VAAHEIVRLANEHAVDLIVIATHGETGWRRLVFGSVAEKVVRLAECPVLTIQPEHDDTK
jgi:nucleotide-binding universal stress UspA family protein